MFCQKCGSEIDNEAVICPHCGVPTQNYNKQPEQPQVIINNTNANTNVVGGAGVSSKSKIACIVLCLCNIIGLGGLHRFYVGKIWTGILWLLTGGLFGLGGLVDLIMILMGNFRDARGLLITQ